MEANNSSEAVVAFYKWLTANGLPVHDAAHNKLMIASWAGTGRGTAAKVDIKVKAIPPPIPISFFFLV